MIHILLTTLIVIKFGEIIKKKSKQFFSLLYFNILFGVLVISIISTSSSTLILFVPSLFVILNPAKDFTFIYIKRFSFNPKLTIKYLACTPFITYALIYSLYNKKYFELGDSFKIIIN